MREAHIIMKWIAAASLVAASIALWPPPTAATFPGSDGRILFVSNRDGNLEVYDVKRNGGSPQNLTVNDADDSSPSISANGKSIAFVSIRDGDADIYSMKTNGTEVTQLTNSDALDNVPTWSQTGNGSPSSATAMATGRFTA